MPEFKAIRGMNDILPDQTPLWQFIESQMRDLMQAYVYREIRLPIVEETGLFARSIGEVTDIVEKEMYTFPDRNELSLTLRPEGTAGCVRACEEHGLLYNQTQRLWYEGPMFRYERPQKGRQRQFHQIGVEAFGMAGADIEAELLAITASLWQRLGVADAVQLEINSIGSLQARGEYKAALVAYLQDRFDQLDADSQRRLDSNPLRILDSKNPETQALLADAPALHDYLDEESAAHHAQLKQNLDALGIAYVENPRLVRGLDYYGKTVFEWTTERLGAQGTVCAGGRYDGLVEQLGGKPTPGVGFAMGVERLCLLVEEVAPDRVLAASADAYFVVMDSELQGQALALAEKLRAAVPGLRLQMHCGGGSLKSQMKKADRSGASFGIMLGSDEAERGVVTLKHLRDKNFEQQTLDHVALIAFFQQS